MFELKTPTKKQVQLVKEFLINHTGKEPISIKLDSHLVSIMIDKDDYDYKLSEKLRKHITDKTLYFFTSLKDIKGDTFLRFNLYRLIEN